MGVLEREIGDLKRMEEILAILAEEGFGLFLGHANLLRRVPLLKRFSHGDTVPTPERVRETFERLGPTFIKFGQILAQRPDIVPPEYITELEKLTDSVPEFDPDLARTIVEKELGPIDDLFAEFQDDPIAAASIAQVHKARLKTGEEVVVKVRRPGIKDQMEKDLDILQFLAARGEKHIGFLNNMQASRIAKEFARWTRDELNLKKEAHNGRVLAENLADEDRIKVPHVYPEYTTERVLVMEYVEGVKSNNVEAIERLNIDAEEVASTAVRAGLKQVIRDGFFHADPHPSNFLISPDGKLIYLDFGMVGKFSKSMRRNLGLLVLHSVNQDVDAAVETIKRIGTVDADADIDGLKDDIEEVMTLLSHSTIQEQSITMTLLDISKRANTRGVHLPPSIAIMGKGLLTMEGIGLTVYPEFQLTDEYRDIVEHLLWEINKPQDLARTFMTDLMQNRDLFARAPTKLNNLVDGLSQPRETTVINKQEGVDAHALVAAALLLGSTLLFVEILPRDQLIYVAIIEVLAAIALFHR